MGYVRVYVLELGRMLKFGFKCLLYVFDEYLEDEQTLLWLIYVYSGVIQTLWFLDVLIRQVA